MKQAKKTRTASMERADGLLAFYARYGTVLHAAAARVHHLVSCGYYYTSTQEVAAWLANDCPGLTQKVFGKEKDRVLRTWRVRALLQQANFLGAFEPLDIKAVCGRGLTAVVRPRLRVVK